MRPLNKLFKAGKNQDSEPDDDYLDYFAQIHRQLDIKLAKNGTYTAARLDKGRGDKSQKDLTIHPPSWDTIPDVFDTDDFEEEYLTAIKPLSRAVHELTSGYTTDNVGQLPIDYEGDVFRLDDFAEIVVSGNQAMISLAGQKELLPAIRAACMRNDLQCTDKAG